MFKVKYLFRSKLFVLITKAISLIIIAIIVNFAPALSLRTNGMKVLTGEYITIYYEKEEAAARDVFELATVESVRIAEALGFNAPQGIRMYIYDKQSTFQTKKYGLIALILDLRWYVGDNRGTNALLTSPANQDTAHGYDDIKNASIHEMVHAYNSVLNKKMPLWINEGVALYLSNGKPRENLYRTSYYIPSLAQMRTSNPIEFSNIGGYDFAHTYIEYLGKVFGWDRVLLLAQTSDYLKAFGMDESEIYSGWIEFLKENYN